MATKSKPKSQATKTRELRKFLAAYRRVHPLIEAEQDDS